MPMLLAVGPFAMVALLGLLALSRELGEAVAGLAALRRGPPEE